VFALDTDLADDGDAPMHADAQIDLRRELGLPPRG
jgi:hypothetical protein